MQLGATLDTVWSEVENSNPMSIWQNKIKNAIVILENKLKKMENNEALQQRVQDAERKVSQYQTVVENLQVTVSNLTNRVNMLEGQVQSLTHADPPNVRPNNHASEPAIPKSLPKSPPKRSETQDDPILADLLGVDKEPSLEQQERPSLEQQERPSLREQTSSEGLLQQLDGAETLEKRLQQKRKRNSMEAPRKKSKPNTPAPPRTNPRPSAKSSDNVSKISAPASSKISAPLLLTQNSVEPENPRGNHDQVLVFADAEAFRLHFNEPVKELTELVRKEKYREAIEGYQPFMKAAELLTVDNEDDEFKKWVAVQYVNNAIALGKTSKLKDAVRLAHKARMLAPWWYKTFSTEASILFKQGKFDQSELVFKEGIQVVQGSGRQRLINKYRSIKDARSRKRKESIISSPGREFRTPAAPASKKVVKRQKGSSQDRVPEERGRIIRADSQLSQGTSKSIIATWNCQKLQNILRFNNCRTGGKKQELVDRLTDAIHHGVIPRCPTCATRGLQNPPVLREASGGWVCPGWFDPVRRTKMTCNFYETEITRAPLRMPDQ